MSSEDRLLDGSTFKLAYVRGHQQLRTFYLILHRATILLLSPFSPSLSLLPLPSIIPLSAETFKNVKVKPTTTTSVSIYLIVGLEKGVGSEEPVDNLGPDDEGD